MLTAIIVEDMPEAMQLLLYDIQNYCADIQVIGTANGVVNAAKLIRQNEPDILFLDISLSDGNGFDILEIFPDLKSKIIFITASDEHAIRAFRFSAIDYLLKPIDIELLQKAVAKVKNFRSESNANLDLLRENIKNPGNLPNKLSLHTLDKIHIVSISDIIRCESDGNNTLIVLNTNEKIFVTKTLKHFEDLLKEHNFIRTHQSHLINFNFIQEFSKKDGGFLKLKNGFDVPVSVRKKAEIIKLLDQMG